VAAIWSHWSEGRREQDAPGSGSPAPEPKGDEAMESGGEAANEESCTDSPCAQKLRTGGSGWGRGTQRPGGQQIDSGSRR